LTTVASDYEVFIAATRSKAPRTGTDTFVDLTTLVHDWRHFPAADPGLPDPLLPQTWPGREAAELFHDRHGRWKQEAWQWWRDADGRSRT
jgi:phenylacetic acid degradation operon negative regulatory protein